MKVYIFIETGLNDPFHLEYYTYTEVYYKKSDATERLRKVYHEESVERVESELIVKAWINDDHTEAYAEYKDNYIHWEVQEKDVIMPETYD